MEFKRFCCFCMTENNKLVDVQTNDVDNISFCVKIAEIMPKNLQYKFEAHPTMICSKCKKKINNFYGFIQDALKAYEIIKKNYSVLWCGSTTKQNNKTDLRYEHSLQDNIDTYNEFGMFNLSCLDIPEPTKADSNVEPGCIVKKEPAADLQEESSAADEEIPENLNAETTHTAKLVTLNLLPEKSRAKYEKQYELFTTWCNNRQIRIYSENVMVDYFSEKAKTKKSSTLWSIYSMLRSVLSVKNDIDINKYNKLMAFLKTQSVGYKATKSKFFTKEQVFKFLLEAPNKTYLMKKVMLIMGIFGACRRDELVTMSINDIEDKDSVLIVTVPDSKTRQSRVFIVNNNDRFVDFLSLYRKYVALRPPDDDTPSRLFLRYSDGKCYKQVVGMNTIGRTPSEIAKYLNLPDANLYTGHSFQRTSTALLANGGGWKISTVAETNYLSNSTSLPEPEQIFIGESNFETDFEIKQEDINTEITNYEPFSNELKFKESDSNETKKTSDAVVSEDTKLSYNDNTNSETSSPGEEDIHSSFDEGPLYNPAGEEEILVNNYYDNIENRDCDPFEICEIKPCIETLNRSLGIEQPNHEDTYISTTNDDININNSLLSSDPLDYRSVVGQQEEIKQPVKKSAAKRQREYRLRLKERSGPKKQKKTKTGQNVCSGASTTI